MADISEQITLLRKKNSLTQEDLAKRVFVSRSLVSLWELGKRVPDDSRISAMSAVFGVDEQFLLDYVKNSEEYKSEMIMIENEIGEITGSDRGSAGSIGNCVRILDAFLSNLNRRDRDLFLSRYLHKKTCKEIASIFMMTKGGVRTKLARIRKKLRNFTDEAGDRYDT